MRSYLSKLRRFFFPPPGARWSALLIAYLTLGILTLSVVVSSVYAWDYTNSPQFCGTACHTMPPEFTAYQLSPHARIACVECHIGREFVGNQILRKAGDAKHIIALAFTDYEFPITARDMRPARETCERCHSPEKFADDSLREIRHFEDDSLNTAYSIYLVLKTGGGSKRQGLGRGIHWHIENRVLYYAADAREQTIPYVRVYKDDGTVDEYVDLQADFDAAGVDEADLREMDCITCHNRITHLVNPPDASLDAALARNVISAAIPDIRRKGVEVLSVAYPTQQHGLNGIAGLDNYYRVAYPEFYAANRAAISAAILSLQEIYQQTVHIEQKSDWRSHPNNVGHQDFPGCFRCHDGKHLNAEQEAIRLECNLCHSIPVVAGTQDFVTNIEISRGLEPKNHLNPNWIVRHRTYLDDSCTACHTTADPGGTSNRSFCSNSACHGLAWDYAGLDAPGLAEIVEAQMPIPTATPVPTPVAGLPTYASTIRGIFQAQCGECHGDRKAGGLGLLTYNDALAGSEFGPVIVPGDAAASRLVKLQSEGHFGRLTGVALDLVGRWIDGGVPER